jgi:hypothetical protein
MALKQAAFKRRFTDCYTAYEIDRPEYEAQSQSGLSASIFSIVFNIAACVPWAQLLLLDQQSIRTAKIHYVQRRESWHIQKIRGIKRLSRNNRAARRRAASRPPANSRVIRTGRGRAAPRALHRVARVVRQTLIWKSRGFPHSRKRPAANRQFVAGFSMIRRRRKGSP